MGDRLSGINKAYIVAAVIQKAAEGHDVVATRRNNGAGWDDFRRTAARSDIVNVESGNVQVGGCGVVQFNPFGRGVGDVFVDQNVTRVGRIGCKGGGNGR
jgi:hypothetical protein